MTGDAHPMAGPSMMPYVKVARNANTSTWPTTSIRRGAAARDSGTNSAVSTSATTPTGMLIQKIARQPIESMSAPPTTGPSARLIPTTPPQMPMAWARSRGSVKTFVMIDIATGLSMLPPTAWTIRNAISQPRPGARLHSNDPSVKTTRPVWNVRRRPIRSPVEPESSNRLASTNV